MRKLMFGSVAVATLLCSASAFADPIQINDDEGYSRLARWEQRLDDRIAQEIRDGSLDPARAWRIQKRLDSIEAHLLQSYYESDNGIDRDTARNYAERLRRIDEELGGNTGNQGNRYERDQYGQSAPSPPPPQYYSEGRYEQQCRQGNAAAGTIFGALAGGLLGGGISHGNGAAIAGGVILGGVIGNSLSRDVDCDNQRYAFASYDDSLNGDIGQPYAWHHGDQRGTFTSTREYRDHGYVCRDFRTVTYRNDQRFERDGTACREDDGNWHFR